MTDRNADDAAPGSDGDADDGAPTATPVWRRRLAFAGDLTPFLIVAFALLLGGTRYGFSPNLDAAEAAFVGAVAFEELGPDGRPPLMSWTLRAALEVFDWDWALAAASVKYGALALYLFFLWDAARRLAGPAVAVTAVAAASFSPPILWLSSVAMGHEILALAATAATANALVRLIERRTVANHLFFGVAAGLGLIASFWFALFLAALLLACALTPATRRLFFGQKPIVAASILLLIATPAYLSAALDPFGLMQASGMFAPVSSLAVIDAPGIGVDGALSVLAAAALWLGPPLGVWMAARWWDGGLEGRTPEQETPATEALLVALGLGALLAIGAALALDATWASPQALAPLFAAAPIYLAVAWPLRRAAPSLCLAGATLFGGLFVAYPAVVATTAHPFAIDYASLGARIAREAGGPAPIVAERAVDGANALISLEGWPGARSPTVEPVANRLVLVWRGRGDPPAGLAPDGFGPAGAIATHVAPYLNSLATVDDGGAAFRIQLWERLPSDPNGAEAGLFGDRPTGS